MPVYFDLIARPELLGLVLTALAAGMLVGAMVYSAVGARLPSCAWLSAGFVVTSVEFVLMASLLSPAVVFAGAAALGIGNAVVGAVTSVLQVQHTPRCAPRTGAQRQDGPVDGCRTRRDRPGRCARGARLAAAGRSQRHGGVDRGPAGRDRFACAARPGPGRRCPMLSSELADLAGVTVRTLAPLPPVSGRRPSRREHPGTTGSTTSAISCASCASRG